MPIRKLDENVALLRLPSRVIPPSMKALLQYKKILSYGQTQNQQNDLWIFTSINTLKEFFLFPHAMQIGYNQKRKKTAYLLDYMHILCKFTAEK